MLKRYGIKLSLNSFVSDMPHRQPATAGPVFAETPRSYWYESFPGSAPIPVSATDMDMKRAVQDISQMAGTRKARAELAENIREVSGAYVSASRQIAEGAQSPAQVNTGVGRAAQAVRQDSATAGEYAASGERSGHSGMLQGLVGQFELTDTSRDTDTPDHKDERGLPSSDTGRFSLHENAGKY